VALLAVMVCLTGVTLPEVISGLYVYKNIASSIKNLGSHS
jgi:hypothetical protein